MESQKETIFFSVSPSLRSYTTQCRRADLVPVSQSTDKKTELPEKHLTHLQNGGMALIRTLVPWFLPLHLDAVGHLQKSKSKISPGVSLDFHYKIKDIHQANITPTPTLNVLMIFHSRIMGIHYCLFLYHQIAPILHLCTPRWWEALRRKDS